MSKLLPDAVRELVRICARLVSGNEACVVLEHVVEMFWVGRERFAPKRISRCLAAGLQSGAGSHGSRDWLSSVARRLGRSFWFVGCGRSGCYSNRFVGSW